jgi:copper(I)-binding protein
MDRAKRTLGALHQPAGAAAIALASALALGGSDAYALFIVNQPWVKPGTRATEAYMVLTSTEDAKLVGVRSPVAARTWLRGPRSKADGIRSTLSLPAGGPVSLQPGAERIGLSGLNRPLKLGDRVPLTLTIETVAGAREEIGVDAEVRNQSPLDAERRAHHR